MTVLLVGQSGQKSAETDVFLSIYRD